MTLIENFPGYFGLPPEHLDDLLRTSHIFLDANFVLNLYEYSPEVFGEYKDVMQNEVFVGRFLMTYQAALEFSRNRHERFERQSGAKEKVNNEVGKSIDGLKQFLQKEYRFHNQIDIVELIGILNKAFSDISKSIEQKYNGEALKGHFAEVDKYVNSLIGANVTLRPSEDRLKHIYGLGKLRYENLIPPGFQDRKKNDESREYGDLVIWLEMIEHCKNNKINKLIFITDDAKEDWWWIHKGKTLGPHPLLIQEMLDNGIVYYQYNSESFLRRASEILGRIASEKAIEQIRSINIQRGQERFMALAEERRASILLIGKALIDLENDLNNNVLDIVEYEQQFLVIVESFISERIRIGRRPGNGLLGEIQDSFASGECNDIQQYSAIIGIPLSDMIKRIRQAIYDQKRDVEQIIFRLNNSSQKNKLDMED